MQQGATIYLYYMFKEVHSKKQHENTHVSKTFIGNLKALERIE